MKKQRLALTMTVGTLAAASLAMTGCGKEGGSSQDAVTFTYWLPAGVDSQFYSELEENPVAKYIEANYTFNDQKVHIDYNVAPAGSQAENFNNLLSTGEYTQVIDMSMSSMTPAEMYDQGMIHDLTELVPEHMPNYMKFMDEHPELKEDMYTIVDGEKKILTLMSVSDDISDNYQGYCYRRDWVAKYGTNPETGEAFTYGFKDENDPESWEDNVVFPSGGSEPLYISDWEWMFEIFDKAMADLGITDGYGYSPYFQVFMQPGDFFSGFGGNACCYWYRSEDETCVFGPQTEDFRAALQCLNTWYEKGWIDPAFAEHSNDIFYAVDSASVFSGKVGLWQGQQSTLGTQIDAGDGGLTDGAVVYGCRQPINDVYGGPESQNKDPRSMLQSGQTGNTTVLTDKISDEDLITFLAYADFLYSDEGAALRGGLTKEQYEKSQDEFYTQHGLTEGLQTVTEENGEKTITFALPTSEPLYKASSYAFGIGRSNVADVDFGYDRYVAQAVDAWDYYPSVGNIFDSAIQGAVSADDNEVVAKCRTNVDQFMARVLPKVVQGEGYDVWDDASWEQFCTDIGKYQPEKVTQIWQNALDLINQ